MHVQVTPSLIRSRRSASLEGKPEGRDFSKDTADVFVTDGFTGNMILKSMEGTAKLQQELIRDSLDRRLIKPVSYIVNKSLKSVNDRFNPDVQNGAFLLGVNGPVTIAHGSSSPTAIKKVGDVLPIKLEPWNHEHRHHHIRTHNIKSKGNAISSRIHLFYNSDIIISKAFASSSMEKLYRNGHYDECIFVHKGKGILKTNFGSLHLSFGDYAIIPRGVVYRA